MTNIFERTKSAQPTVSQEEAVPEKTAGTGTEQWSEPTREEKDELIGLMVALRDSYTGKPRADWCQSIINAISTPENLDQAEIDNALKMYNFLQEESKSAFSQIRNPKLLEKIGPLLHNVTTRAEARLTRE